MKHRMLVAFMLLLLFGVITRCSALVVVLAPHPDDGEASCGGLMANTVDAGGRVVLLTMTGGEHGVPGKSEADARDVRAAEAGRAAAALGAELQFFGAIDGSLAVDAAATEKLAQILIELNPDIVVAPWPMDVHPDHQATGMLAWRVFQDKRLHFELYFFETSNPPHTKTFQFAPTHYIDITGAMARKQKALYEHVSQFPQGWFGMYKKINEFRGYESDVAYAEAYLKAQNSSGLEGRPAVVAKTLSK